MEHQPLKIGASRSALDGQTAESDGQERRQRRFLSVADISDGRSDISDGLQAVWLSVASRLIQLSQWV